MGCDIHLTVEKRVDGKWERVDNLPPRPCSWCEGRGHYEGRPQDACYSCVTDPDSGKPTPGVQSGPYDDRNYTVFAVLANVRNDGHVTPIDRARGLPADAARRGGEDGDWDYGDHSFSWLNLRELLAYDWKQTIGDDGWVSEPTFRAWHAAGAIGHPKEWSGGVGGGRVVHITPDEMLARVTSGAVDDGNSYYTHIKWTVRLDTYCRHFIRFMETLTAIGEPDDVRIVFGFDS